MNMLFFLQYKPYLNIPLVQKILAHEGGRRSGHVGQQIKADGKQLLEEKICPPGKGGIFSLMHKFLHH